MALKPVMQDPMVCKVLKQPSARGSMSKLLLLIFGAILLLFAAAFLFLAVTPAHIEQNEIVVEVPNSRFE